MPETFNFESLVEKMLTSMPLSYLKKHTEGDIFLI